MYARLFLLVVSVSLAFSVLALVVFERLSFSLLCISYSVNLTCQYCGLMAVACVSSPNASGGRSRPRFTAG